MLDFLVWYIFHILHIEQLYLIKVDQLAISGDSFLPYYYTQSFMTTHLQGFFGCVISFSCHCVLLSLGLSNIFRSNFVILITFVIYIIYLIFCQTHSCSIGYNFRNLTFCWRQLLGARATPQSFDCCMSSLLLATVQAKPWNAFALYL